MNKTFKNVCITGAGNGIGKAIAIAMSKEGYNVICADIDFEEAKKTVEIISSNNGSGLAIKTDVTNVEDIKDMVNKVVEQFGSLDVMVNNAGVTRTSSIMDLDE